LGIWTDPLANDSERARRLSFHPHLPRVHPKIKSKKAVKETTTLDHQFFETFQTPGVGDSFDFQNSQLKHYNKRCPCMSSDFTGF
jgi:hypothetical protein